MDFLAGTLCMGIGCAVAWMIALYTARGERLLIWDTLYATTGAAACYFALAWLAPRYQLAGLVVLGPLAAMLAITLGDAARRAVSGRIG